MNVIAWIFAGLAAGLLVSHLFPGPRGQGRTVAVGCVIGVAGALSGGWAATSLLPAHSTAGLVSVVSALGALAMAALVLTASHTLTRRSGDPGAGMLPALQPSRPSRAPR